MRVLVAISLAVAVALAAVAPHVHLQAAGAGGEECALCLARGGEVATRRSPDLRPREARAEVAAVAPVQHPHQGAPMGAVPGQSPPLA